MAGSTAPTHRTTVTLSAVTPFAVVPPLSCRPLDAGRHVARDALLATVGSAVGTGAEAHRAWPGAALPGATAGPPAVPEARRWSRVAAARQPRPRRCPRISPARRWPPSSAASRRRSPATVERRLVRPRCPAAGRRGGRPGRPTTPSATPYRSMNCRIVTLSIPPDRDACAAVTHGRREVAGIVRAVGGRTAHQGGSVTRQDVRWKRRGRQRGRLAFLMFIFVLYPVPVSSLMRRALHRLAERADRDRPRARLPRQPHRELRPGRARRPGRGAGGVADRRARLGLLPCDGRWAWWPRSVAGGGHRDR